MRIPENVRTALIYAAVIGAVAFIVLMGLL